MGFVRRWLVIGAAALVTSCGTSRPAASHSSSTSVTSTTTTAVETTSLTVVSCPTTFALATQPSTVPLPTTVSVTVPETQADSLAIYSDTSDLMMLIGPRGWSCVATYGADGSGGVAVYPNGSSFPAVFKSGPPYTSSSEAVTGTETGGSPVQAAAQACSFFPAAAATTQSDLGHGCSSRPTSETLAQVSSSVVGFEDPPGVSGTGDPSGGPYPANGVVSYSSTAQPGTYVGTCTLPQAEHDVCTTILNYFASQYGGTRPGVPKSFP